MKRFKYRLQKVLQYRRSIQEEKKGILALALQRQKEAEDHLTFLDQEFSINEIRELDTFPVDEVYIRGAYSARLKEEIARQKIKILQLVEEVDVARANYIEATKEAEVLEKLKERKREEYEFMAKKQEEAFLDELVTQRQRYNGFGKE